MNLRGPKHHSNAEEVVFIGKLAHHLQKVYPSDFSESLVNRICTNLAPLLPAKEAPDEKDVVLITYADNILNSKEKPLTTLHRFLKGRLSGIFSCIHVLPFFPSTSDDGFAVSDYLAVHADFGSWNEIEALISDFDLMADLVINHVSADHPWFKNFLRDAIPGRGYFIEKKPHADYSRVTRPRSTPLFTDFPSTKGIRQVWTTFSADQVDLNFANPEVLVEMIRVMLLYIRKGVRIIRLDAVAFLWKEAGTECLHLPETHEIIKILREIATYVCPGTLIVTETNVPDQQNFSYFGKGDEAHMVYQFALPPLLLYTLLKGNSEFLNAWASSLPVLMPGQTFLNFTASHDGIGLRPLEGLIPRQETELLIKTVKDFGGRVSMKDDSDGSQSPYELNITYNDALKGTFCGEDDYREERFICSQTIMMSMQGVPAFYIHSLTGTDNDEEGVCKTGKPRSINRRRWKENEIETLLAGKNCHQRIFDELLRIIRIRKSHTAFHPEATQQIESKGRTFFTFLRTYQTTGEKILCISNITANQQVFKDDFIGSNQAGLDLLCNDTVFKGSVHFRPYQTRWLLISAT